MEKKFKIYNEALTDAAKNIFGDIVDKGYITVYCWGDTEEELEQCFQRELSGNGTIIKNNNISFDSDNIIIDFVNGKSVSFRASKSGWIKTAIDYEENAK